MFWWGKQEGKKPLRSPWNRREDNIKIDLKDIGWVDLHSVRMIQNRDKWRVVVNSVINSRAPEICKFYFCKRQKGQSMRVEAVTAVTVTTSVF
jgi:hypothetical protein